MMLRRSLRKRIASAVIAVVILFTISPWLFAAEPHQDPEIAKLVFSGIFLFRYYSGSLDFVLQKDPAEVEARLEKMPFANIPQSLEGATDNFATSGIEISYLVVKIAEDLDRLRGLIGQSRLKEATKLATGTFASLSQANSELESLEQATEITGEEFKVFSAPAGSDLRRSYDELLERLDRIRQMLDLYKSLLLSLFLNFGAIGNITSAEEAAKLAEQLAVIIEQLREAGVSEELTQQLQAIIEMLRKGDISAEEAAKLAEQLVIIIEQLREAGVSEELIQQFQAIMEMLKKGDLSAEEAAKLAKQLAALMEQLREAGVSEELLSILAFGRLLPTAITLEIEPTIAFVGEDIRFEGVLTSEKKPLAGREVDILINSSRYVTSQTDTYGHYQGRLPVPYWYVPELELQALYYPRGKDVGLYLASLSPVVKLTVLFYEAELELTVEDKAYPGRETTIAGRFNYGQSPPLSERKAEIYFDNLLSTEVVAQETFVQKIVIDPAVDVGEHLITVSASAVGRYAPVVANAVLNVTRATPILDIAIPKVALIPGSLGLGGRLYSEVGPLSEALIKMGLGKSEVELVSSEAGAFDTKIRVGMGFGVIGWQDLVIRVLPQEPWHAPLNTTSSVLMVNVINCGGILAILIFLGIYLPGRLRERLRVYPKRRARPVPAILPPEIAPVYSDSTILPSSTREGGQASGEPRSRIFYWYRLVVRLIQGVSRVLLAPHQTLREFAYQSSRVLGPAAKYFIEMTKMVERLLYSQYRSTEEDAEKSQQLSDSVEEGLKGEGV